MAVPGLAETVGTEDFTESSTLIDFEDENLADNAPIGEFYKDRFGVTFNGFVTWF
jgi:hypothetical protein